MNACVRRLGIGAAIGIAMLPMLRAVESPVRTQQLKGKVIALAGYFEKQGAKLDKDAAEQWYALQGDDGKLYPLIKDEGSRMFFTDPRLLNRPMRLTGRIVGDGPFFQVFQVHSYLNGQLHDVYYWCDVCTIKRFEKKDCECCGAPMELREIPVK
ncbi:hypothetical protein AYO44_07785 [Planctomycetaceae bacterium SCGC AG-212-F19]|nr:hypothetical protein AYO44_07785 [Planctomycetaceae bacterium SCGC AG-212-F19]